jgi:hypothetical protein
MFVVLLTLHSRNDIQTCVLFNFTAFSVLFCLTFLCIYWKNPVSQIQTFRAVISALKANDLIGILYFCNICLEYLPGIWIMWEFDILLYAVFIFT